MPNDLVEGFYTDEELALLESTAQKCAESPCTFVEVGVYRGRSASVLSAYASDLVLVDNLQMGDFSLDWPASEFTFTSVHEAASALGDVVLLHHDADHTFDVVFEHLKLLLPKVIVGGYVCLHDYYETSYPGVARAWQAATVPEEWAFQGKANSLAVFRKLEVPDEETAACSGVGAVPECLQGDGSGIGRHCGCRGGLCTSGATGQ